MTTFFLPKGSLVTVRISVPQNIGFYEQHYELPTEHDCIINNEHMFRIFRPENVIKWMPDINLTFYISVNDLIKI